MTEYEYTYDEAGYVLSVTKTCDGELVETSTYEYEFNKLGLPKSRIESVDGQAKWKTVYQYDMYGNVVSELQDVAVDDGGMHSYVEKTYKYTYFD